MVNFIQGIMTPPHTQNALKVIYSILFHRAPFIPAYQKALCKQYYPSSAITEMQFDSNFQIGFSKMQLNASNGGKKALY